MGLEIDVSWVPSFAIGDRGVGLGCAGLMGDLFRSFEKERTCFGVIYFLQFPIYTTRILCSFHSLLLRSYIHFFTVFVNPWIVLLPSPATFATIEVLGFARVQVNSAGLRVNHQLWTTSKEHRTFAIRARWRHQSKLLLGRRC